MGKKMHIIGKTKTRTNVTWKLKQQVTNRSTVCLFVYFFFVCACNLRHWRRVKKQIKKKKLSNVPTFDLLTVFGSLHYDV